MVKTLRRRLILSHALPLLVIIPLAGIAFVYVLETQVVLVNLSGEVAGQAVLIAEIASEHPEIWYDPIQAQLFVARVAPRLTARLMLLDAGGRLLASSDPGDSGRLGQPLQLADLASALAGEISVRTIYSTNLHTEIADVLVPVLGPDQRLVGIVRLSHTLANVYERFLRLRYLVLAILASAGLVGVVAGWVLAVNLETPLRRLSQAVYWLASGQQTTPLPEEGPTEIRLLFQAYNSLLERLHTLEEARRQLVANLVHELGRPLGALRSAVQALLRGADRDPVLRRELLAGIDQEITHLQRLLDDLARLRDQVVGTLELSFQPLALSQWLPRTLAPWQATALEKGLHWQATTPDELPILMADADRLAQALGNLLSNAIKYTSPGGTVSVDAGMESGSVWIRVSDTGPGIALAEQTRIFTPLYRGREARRFPQGMGLGLSIARDLAIAHGGRLELESTPGLGSHFTLWLPLTPTDSTAETSSSSPIL